MLKKNSNIHRKINLKFKHKNSFEFFLNPNFKICSNLSFKKKRPKFKNNNSYKHDLNRNVQRVFKSTTEYNYKINSTVSIPDLLKNNFKDQNVLDRYDSSVNTYTRLGNLKYFFYFFICKHL